MEKLYAPWRSQYISKNNKKIQGCVFCHISKHTDEHRDLGVLYRDEKCFVVMNKYPYSPGHVMVIPHVHLDNLEELDEQTWSRMGTLVKKTVKMLKAELNCTGVNLGMNMGEAGGAGIPKHIHYHIVPRWRGDTNFITTIADTRVYSVDFDKIYTQLLQSVSKYF